MRRRAALLLLLLAVAASGAACRATGRRGSLEPLIPQPTPRPAIPVVVEVFGTPGVPFEGSYGELGQTKTAKGNVPARLTFETTAGFTVSLQKRVDKGELGIQVIVGGKAVHRSSTIREFGLVTYTHRVP